MAAALLVFLPVASLAVAAESASPVEAKPPATPTFGEEVSVGWVLVPAVVRSPAGYVENLKKKDFRLFVDERPVPIVDFEPRTDAPFSLVILQDVSGSMEILGKLEASREALSLFFDRAVPGDEFALASFADTGTQVDVPFTEDLEALREAMAAWRGWGRTALHDAISWLPKISVASANARRAAILVTDGIDNASHLSPTAARDLVRRADLPVYVLGLSVGDPFALDAKGQKAFRYADALNLLASLTGGRYHAVTGPEDLKEACASIADELRAQYVMSFPTATAGTPAYHRIRLELPERRELRVLTRQGYEGLPPQR